MWSNVSNFEEFIALPEDFEGTVRLFPLPNFVMFPGVLQPFHIFELRYREMLRDALDDDRLIALASLLPGSDSDYEAVPPLRKWFAWDA